MIKVMTFLRRHPGLSRAEFHDRWLNHHAPLVSSVPDFWRFVRGYRQNHALAELAIFGDAPGAEPFDGCAELWFDSLDALRQAMATPGYRDVIQPDEMTCFADLSKAAVLIVTEHQIAPLDSTIAASGSCQP